MFCTVKIICFSCLLGPTSFCATNTAEGELNVFIFSHRVSDKHGEWVKVIGLSQWSPIRRDVGYER